jgi:hypothetical protein
MNPFVKRKKENYEKIFAWREGMLRMARHAVHLRHSLAQDDMMGWAACRFQEMRFLSKPMSRDSHGKTLAIFFLL